MGGTREVSFGDGRRKKMNLEEFEKVVEVKDKEMREGNVGVQEKVKRVNPIRKFFKFSHLPGKLQRVSKAIAEVAWAMDDMLPDCAEKSAGLRKLLEAKDCFVRAELERDER